MEARRDTPRERGQRFLARARESGGIRGGLARHRREIPPDILRDASRRLALAALVGASVTTLNLLIFTVIPLLTSVRLGQPPGMVDAWIGAATALSLAVFFLARWDRLSPRRALDMGLVYLVAAALIAALATASSGGRVPKFGVSHICTAILLFPVIVPNTPGKVLLAGLLAASMDPLVITIAKPPASAGLSAADLFDAYYWNYICAVLALVPAHVLTRLSREVGEARELGGYRLTERLGKGGMGEVWRGSHRLLARQAAIKIIQPEILGGEGEQREKTLLRFEREAQATAGLQSPHTIELYDFGVSDEGTFYYVMELLDGLDLESLVRRFGPVPPERAVFLLRQACHSLADAHAAGLIHRDIKPANIFACRRGLDADFVKVLDFGLVKGSPAGLEGEVLLSDEQTVRGTPAYIAPESLRGGEVDGRADLYALGCVAYWLLTGRLVFEGENAMDVLAKHLSDEPDPPSARSEMEIPPELDEIVLACLRKHAGERPASARELSEMLARVPLPAPWTEERAADWWALNMPRRGEG